MVRHFYTLWLTIFRPFAPAGNSKCFRQSAAPPPLFYSGIGNSVYLVTLLIIAIKLSPEPKVRCRFTCYLCKGKWVKAVVFAM